jgi:hypothetical protein
MRHHSTLFFAMCFTVSLASIAPAQPRRPATAAEHKADREAVARERARRDLLRDLESGRLTLPEAAQRSGGALTIDWRPNPDWFKERDIRGLADRSALVIVGRPFAARVELTPDRRSIVTTYSVQVDERFKERQIPPFMQHVTVRIPGGRMEFGDGVSAEVRSGPSLKIGDRYMFFLQREQDAASLLPDALPGTSAASPAPTAADKSAVIYTPFRIDQGVFHLPADGKIRSEVHEASDQLHRYDGKAETEFLAEVKAAVAAAGRF